MRVFRGRRDFLRFKHTLQRYTEKERIYIHHYVLMHTHFHLLAWIDDTSVLARAIKALSISYSHYYCRRYGYKGHLWHSRYRSIIIKDDYQWAQCGRYIELNPVYAGICNCPDAHPWSSYQFYARGRSDVLVRPVMLGHDAVQKSVRNENVQYQAFVMAGIDMDYRRLKKEFEVELRSGFGTSKSGKR